eukprot:TRINITY_DN2918_c0_g1::TRINITY_DN2918_c0_g1_i3::g.4348::m.4348 TRINITY_DN2918_c0_g1::TRINITY_DN2918_c0_g1_i3::g.4348  ORF type:complete len:2265 (+),score=833.61,sp/Q149M9/NWD1_HUMAN/29.79/4e-82,MBT/PF02820.13/1.8e-14,MBT/PF02820.13/30,MBT/PF02820.13/0.24,MBT/PF02820.13/5.3e-16,MBT/PF02820.13/1e-12,WD40/PF00400.27/5.9e-12,WD40/PF00400.27/18,WD40/PF00400.27/8.4,WD40/PF00400.27/5.5e-06,WD40/PF00400.27/4.3e-11,AAA_16/PF13191.1/4.8e-11,NACHT/PF05729.7/7.4e-10,EF-hand_6/PF13405.1/0.0003,EF-hand_5/PF13
MSDEYEENNNAECPADGDNPQDENNANDADDGGEDGSVYEGMKVEALDQSEFNTVSVATLGKYDEHENKWLVHFDGWEKSYDFWTTIDKGDIAPPGTAAQNGLELIPPKDYPKFFIWSEYLVNSGAKAAPVSAWEGKAIFGAHSSGQEYAAPEKTITAADLFNEGFIFTRTYYAELLDPEDSTKVRPVRLVDSRGEHADGTFCGLEILVEYVETYPLPAELPESGPLPDTKTLWVSFDDGNLTPCGTCEHNDGKARLVRPEGWPSHVTFNWEVFFHECKGASIPAAVFDFGNDIGFKILGESDWVMPSEMPVALVPGDAGGLHFKVGEFVETLDINDPSRITIGKIVQLGAPMIQIQILGYPDSKYWASLIDGIFMPPGTCQANKIPLHLPEGFPMRDNFDWSVYFEVYGEAGAAYESYVFTEGEAPSFDVFTEHTGEGQKPYKFPPQRIVDSCVKPKSDNLNNGAEAELLRQRVSQAIRGETKNWKAVFDAFDLDHTGTLTPQELRTALLQLGYDMGEVEIIIKRLHGRDNLTVEDFSQHLGFLFEADSSRMVRAMTGDFTGEIKPKAKLFRIFTSSTFTDTKHERDTLMVQVYPHLRNYCTQAGFDFQVVDMRWGIRDESTDDHKTTELCMTEIKKCQELSAGVCFTTFYAQKYGYRPFSRCIAKSEYEPLYEQVCRTDTDAARAAKVNLETWFKLNENFVPALYELQPVTPEAKPTWWTTFESMQMALRQASADLWGADSERARPFHMSVTEHEIWNGILNAKNPSVEAYWFKRTIHGINPEDRESRNYIDLVYGQPKQDEGAARLLDKLKTELMPTKLPRENIFEWDVQWTPKGIDPENADHATFIKDFVSTFQRVLENAIDDAIVRGASDPKDPIFTEAVHHNHLCSMKCDGFVGREDVLDQIGAYLNAPATEPLVVVGPSGSGKTSIVAMAAMKAKLKRGKNCPVVVRFLGTSPDSSAARTLMRSVCTQILQSYEPEITKAAAAAAKKGEEPVDYALIPDKYELLIPAFVKYLSLASAEKPMIVMLDSLDQLTDEDCARTTLEWLPLVLPPHVHLIVSTLPEDQYGVMPAFRRQAIPDTAFLYVPKFRKDETESLIDAWLGQGGRALAPPQRAYLSDIVAKGDTPLFYRLAYDESCRWRSFDPVADSDTGPGVRLAPSVRGLIDTMFARLERYHGTLLVSHAFSAITAARFGLTNNEVEDVISCDDVVLKDVFLYWTPPTMRLPPLLWTRIRSDLGGYMVERGADGVNVLAWYHRQFWETVEARYFSNQENETAAHNALAEYFSGTYYAGKLDPRSNEVKARHVPAMPYTLKGKLGEDNVVVNRRRMSERVYHLSKAQRWSEVVSELTSLDYVESKCAVGQLYDLINEYIDCLTHGGSAKKAMKAGQRVEAVDLKNPHLICVATLRAIEGENALIHFDGWSSDYDYWCRIEDGHFAPPGTCGINGLDFEPPLSYQKAFDWPTYLKETGSDPCPNELFTEQKITIFDQYYYREGQEYILPVVEARGGSPNGVSAELLDRVGAFKRFVLQRAHVLANEPQLLIQEALNQPDFTEVAEAARAAVAEPSASRVLIPMFIDVTKKQTRDPCLLLLKGHKGAVRALSFNHDGKLIATASDDGTIRVWSADSGQTRASIDLPDKKDAERPRFRCLAFSPKNSEYLVGSGREGEVFVYDGKKFERVHQFEFDDAAGKLISSLAFHPDGELLAVTSNYAVEVYKTGTWERLWTRKFADRIVFTRDGLYAIIARAAADNQSSVIVAEPMTGKVLKRFKSDALNWHITYPVSPFAAAMQGGIITAALLAGSTQIQLVVTQPPEAAQQNGEGEGEGAAEGDENNAAVGEGEGEGAGEGEGDDNADAGGQEGDGNADDTDTDGDGEEDQLEHRALFEGAIGLTKALAFAPDGTLVASGSLDGSCRLWDATVESTEPSDPCIAQFLGHSAPITDIQFDPYGKMFASSSEDGTVRVWDRNPDVPPAAKETFQPGQRLEATDRKNPTLRCVVSVMEVSKDGKRVMIHFDGWGEDWDYWAIAYSRDIAPVNTAYLLGDSLSTPGEGDDNANEKWGDSWEAYLANTGYTAAPRSCFAIDRLDECFGQDFKINKIIFLDDNRILTPDAVHCPLVWSAETGEVIGTYSDESPKILEPKRQRRNAAMSRLVHARLNDGTVSAIDSDSGLSVAKFVSSGRVKDAAVDVCGQKFALAVEGVKGIQLLELLTPDAALAMVNKFQGREHVQAHRNLAKVATVAPGEKPPQRPARHSVAATHNA